MRPCRLHSRAALARRWMDRADISLDHFTQGRVVFFLFSCFFEIWLAQLHKVTSFRFAFRSGFIYYYFHSCASYNYHLSFTESERQTPCSCGIRWPISFLDNATDESPACPFSHSKLSLRHPPYCTLEVPHARPRDRKIRTKRLAFGGTA